MRVEMNKKRGGDWDGLRFVVGLGRVGRARYGGNTAVNRTRCWLRAGWGVVFGLSCVRGLDGALCSASVGEKGGDCSPPLMGGGG